MVATLSSKEVLDIYDVLVKDFASTSDPISPVGVRENGQLLESAVARQHTGYDGVLKYANPTESAATLGYGICCNHVFYNGNKRAALVSMLCHLDKNNFTLSEDIGQEQLYSLMIKIASHHFAPKRARYDSSDTEIKLLASWLFKNTRKMRKGEKVVTFRELRKILRTYHYEMENPQKNYIDIVKYERKRSSIFGKKERVGSRVLKIPYPREGQVVGKKVLKSVREKCKLTEKEGYDSEIFYRAEPPIDQFIIHYKKTLIRLART